MFCYKKTFAERYHLKAFKPVCESSPDRLDADLLLIIQDHQAKLTSAPECVYLP